VALKLLVPVIPSDRFYDAVVAAADLIAREGGTISFLFTALRPPAMWESEEDVGNQTALEVDADLQDSDDDTVDRWQQEMREGLDDANALLRERGVSEEQVNVLFADPEAPPAQAIADEAAAGAYDMVVLSKGEIGGIDEDVSSRPADIATAVQELADDGVKLLVT
jgi:hypothetical protein